MQLISNPQIFAQVRDGRLAKLHHVDVALDSARNLIAGTALEIAIAGDALYIDSDPNDGRATLYLQADIGDSAEVPLSAGPGAIFNVPFTKLRVANSAQAGKKIRIIYGVGVQFQPGSVAQVSITGAVNAPVVTPNNEGTAVVGTSSSAVLAANSARKYLLMQNQGTAAIQINTGGGNAQTSGLILQPGAVYEPLVVPLGVINAYSGTAGQNLHYIEG